MHKKDANLEMILVANYLENNIIQKRVNDTVMTNVFPLRGHHKPKQHAQKLYIKAVKYVNIEIHTPKLFIHVTKNMKDASE